MNYRSSKFEIHMPNTTRLVGTPSGYRRGARQPPILNCCLPNAFRQIREVERFKHLPGKLISWPKIIKTVRHRFKRFVCFLLLFYFSSSEFPWFSLSVRVDSLYSTKNFLLSIRGNSLIKPSFLSGQINLFEGFAAIWALLIEQPCQSYLGRLAGVLLKRFGGRFYPEFCLLKFPR